MYHTVENPSAGRWTLLPGANIAGLLFCMDCLGKTAFFTGAADDEDCDGQPVILYTAIESSE
jgi:hypothetical protein